MPGMQSVGSSGSRARKTAVLVERILQLILKDGVPIDRLLVVTLTAMQLPARCGEIGPALVKAIDRGSGDNEHLRQQLNLLSRASISTIHPSVSALSEVLHVINLDLVPVLVMKLSAV